MKVFCIIAIFAIFLIACDPPQVEMEPVTVTETVRDFTQFNFIETATRPVDAENYTHGPFLVQSDAGIQDLDKAKADLMFYDFESGVFLDETYELYAPYDTERRKDRLLMTKDSIVSVEDKRKENIFFVVKFEFDNHYFFSNFERPFFSEELSAPPPPPSSIPECLEKLENMTVQNILEQFAFEDFDPSKEYSIYTVDPIMFASGYYSVTEDNNPVGDAIQKIVDCIKPDSASGENLKDAFITNVVGFIFLGTASDADLIRIIDNKVPDFEQETVYLVDQDLNVTEKETFTKTDTSYSNADLPKLRALEGKCVATSALRTLIPDIENRIAVCHQPPAGEDVEENRRLTLFIIHAK